MNKITHPLNNIVWIDREELKANNYNPNKVAPPELELLKISIIEDGWTQPIVVNKDYTIVDGFHRWTVSGHKEIYKLTDGKVPIVILKETTKEQQMMATIRHNRARGTHGVLAMSDIINTLLTSGVSANEIIKRLKMESEEVQRLGFRAGIPKSKIFENKEFSKAWEPK